MENFEERKIIWKNFQNVNFDKVSAVLGHIASKKEILVDPVKIDTVSNGERPRASAESKRFFFFFLAGYYIFERFL